MFSLTVAPQMLTAATGNRLGIGSAMSAENAAPAAPTTGVVPAADEVSALTALQFAAQAQMYQAVSAQAAVINECSRTPLAPALIRMRVPKPPTRSRPAKHSEVK